ncbi:MAG TPA: hypothetical protein VMO26_27385 [Vicinamibacterales bacterium]|nr:hypothetical protein [Vicinamibacterales bacterium]
MAPVDPEALRDPESIALARTLRDAKTVEDLLTQAGVDYVVQVETYAHSFLFGTPRHGAVFYVTASQASYCRARMSDAGLGKAVIDEEPAPQK